MEFTVKFVGLLAWGVKDMSHACDAARDDYHYWEHTNCLNCVTILQNGCGDAGNVPFSGVLCAQFAHTRFEHLLSQHQLFIIIDDLVMITLSWISRNLVVLMGSDSAFSIFCFQVESQSDFTKSVRSCHDFTEFVRWQIQREINWLLVSRINTAR